MSFDALLSFNSSSFLTSYAAVRAGDHGAVSPYAELDEAIRAQRTHEYPHQLWWLIASFIGLLAITHFLSWATSRGSSKVPSREKTTDPEAGGGALVTPGVFSWRNLPTALVNLYRVVAFRWSLNIGKSYTLNFAEVFVTCAYIVALFTWEFLNTTNLEGQKFDAYYYTNRAAVLAISQFPLITALGTKNNIVAYITGISYDKLNYIHRMSARVAFILLWLPFFVPYPAIFELWYIRVGLTALSAFSILFLVSLRPIRSRAYEIFYFTHFLMVLWVILLIGAYIHANNFEYGYYVWPCFLIWGLDRFLRFARVVYYNHLYFGFRSKANPLDASVELLSPHFVRLHIHRPPHFSWTPGQTAFLIMPTVSGFPLEAHPFTIASVDSHYQLQDAKTPTTDGEKRSSDTVDVAPFWKELVFLINVREGFTKRLAAIAEKGEKVKVLVDGPYGFSPNLDNDDTVVLVAGGSGVTFTLSTFLGVLSHVQNKKSKCRKIVFIWSIRDASHIEWISRALSQALELAPSDLEIVIRIYVTSKGAGDRSNTQGKPWNEDDSIHSSAEVASIRKIRPWSLLDFPAVQVVQGRPDLPALLKEEIDASTGRLSVTVCGSQGIARVCRKALRIPFSIGLGGGPSVVLHVESFGYA
ncbi:ferric reductase NAD binding domain-containing protein [Earliella scabrosa]|nr:ferric reductase NAD binding domain-containing protein [Earliella scabrosa]